MSARDTTLAIIASRSRGTTICPSEVARTLAAAYPGTAAADWRGLMPVVHAAIDGLVLEDLSPR